MVVAKLCILGYTLSILLSYYLVYTKAIAEHSGLRDSERQGSTGEEAWERTEEEWQAAVGIIGGNLGGGQWQHGNLWRRRSEEAVRCGERKHEGDNAGDCLKIRVLTVVCGLRAAETVAFMCGCRVHGLLSYVKKR